MSADQLDDQLDDQQLQQLDDQLDQGDDAAPFDPMALLTMAELDAGSRLLKASLVHAITQGTVDYAAALAVVGYLLERRTSPATTVGAWKAKSWQQLHDDLSSFDPGRAVEAGPTAPGHG